MNTNFFKRSAVLLAGVGVATAISVSSRAANPFSSLSSSCQDAINGVLSNPEASSCLNVPGLAAIITLSSNTSAVEPLNTWLQGMCAANACSNETVQTATTNVTNGCQSDLKNVGVSDGTLADVIQAIPTFYSTVRDIGCLKTSSNNTLCVSSTLLDIQTFLGKPLSPNNAISSIMAIFGDIKSSNLPASITCTGCIQKAFNLVQNESPSVTSDPAVQSAVASQCGSNFLSGTPPSDVVAGTGSAAPTGSLAALNANKTNSAFAPVTPMLGLACSTLLAFTACTFIFFA